MLRNYRLRFVLLIVLLALVMTAPVLGDPGPFDKITPPDGAEHQPLTPTFSWEDSVDAVRYEYCYDTTDDDLCEDEAWIEAGTVTLPPSGLEYNTTYYWQVRAIDAGSVITYANSGTWWSFTTQNPALTVGKALTGQSASPIALGTVLTYTITATNTGDVDLSNVVVNDTLIVPTGGTSPCVTLTLGANCTLVGAYTVTQADVDAGQIVNTGSAVSDEVTVAVTDTVTTSIPQHPALTVDKVLTGQSTTQIASGTVLTYTITATNSGDVTLHNVAVADTLVTPDSETCPSVGPGGTCVLVGAYTVTQADMDAGQIINTGSAVSNETPTPVEDEVTTPLEQSPAMTVDKVLTGQSTTQIALGTVLTYTITATNAGDVTLHNVAVADTLVTPDSETCPSVGPGGTCVLVGAYTVTQADMDAGQIINTGSAVSNETPTPVEDEVTTPLEQSPAMTVDKALTGQSDTPIASGTVLTYTITATNAGNVTLHNVAVVDTSVTPDLETCLNVGPGGTCVLVGAYTVTQADMDAGLVVNTGSAVSTETPTPVEDEVITPLEQHPALTVDKVLTGQSATPIALGTVLTYTITATNSGDVTLFDVVVSDSLLTPASWDCGTVTPDAICVLTGSYEAQEADFMAGEIVNTATATADDSNGDPLTPVTDLVTTPLVAAPPVAYPDTSSGNPIDQAVTVNVLANDVRGDLPLDPTSVVIVGAPGDGKFLEVSGEGYWLVSTITGTTTFVPATGFTGNPTPINYTVDDVQGNTSNAATVTITYTPQPEANDDALLGNPIGQPVTLDVLDNDEAAAGRTLDPASVHILGADNGTGGKVLTVSGEGVWTVDSDTGEITFTPEVGFEGNPAAIQYTVDDDQGNTSNAATVVVSYTDNPLARNDISSGNPVGSAVTVDVLANDVAAGVRTLDPASVQIAGTANPGDSLVVTGQGAWSVNTTTGAITFTPEEGFDGNPTPIAYTMADDQGNVSNTATVMVTYTEPPVANDDESTGNLVGNAVIVDVLANDIAADNRDLDPASVQITGTMNPGDSLVVAGQGTWSVYTATGAITFTPEEGFDGDPTPIAYTVADDQGNVSNAATVTVTFYTPPPMANDDESTSNLVGSSVTVDVLANDVPALYRTLDPATVHIEGTTNPGDSLVVAGQGTWSVYTATGAITFTPEGGFDDDPTPIAYTVADDWDNVSNAATVTVTFYTPPPVANDDTSLDNLVGSVVTVTVLANDVPALYRTLDPASVQITGTANPGDSFVVMGQGTWSVYTATGAITFIPEGGFDSDPTPITYTVADDRGNLSNAATVTVTFYTPPPVANDDESTGNLVGSVVTVTVLANDVAALYRTLDPASVQITGTESPGDNLEVIGQGTWSVYTITGAIIFTPEEGFGVDPTPIAYTVDDDQGNTSNLATVTITYADKQFFIYLPLTVRLWPPIPTTPVLNVIDNLYGYGDYTVSWSAAERVTSYVLQESPTSSFSDAVQVYSGTNTSIVLSDRGPTRYYYRVQARNAYGESAWSNVRLVDVLWEKEPNDDVLTEANGPLISGLTYYGHFPSGVDQQDYFFIDLQSAQSVELWLNNIAAGQDYDLTLRDTALHVVAHSGELGNANEHIRTGILPAGWYYIQIYNRSGNGSTQPYYLRVSYPATVLTAFDGDVPMPAPWFSNAPPVP